ncbi:MAG: hypothetical protein JXR83_13735 [Deltaproteobacteria bacterium]|nr:hypothetical protein [Deltaproteobacteria bacterium]
MKRLLVALVAALAAWSTACPIPEDWVSGWDGGFEDGPRIDRRGFDDAGARIDAGLSDERPLSCPLGLQCLSGAAGCACCGWNGPQRICLCSNPCNDDLDCRQPGLSWCNRPDLQSPGICTAPGFNCCWQCQ